MRILKSTTLIRQNEIELCDCNQCVSNLSDRHMFVSEREKLRREVEKVLYLENVNINNADLKSLLGIVENISKTSEIKLLSALLTFIHETSNL